MHLTLTVDRKVMKDLLNWHLFVRYDHRNMLWKNIDQ